jgi:hypothetical protein
MWHLLGSLVCGHILKGASNVSHGAVGSGDDRDSDPSERAYAPCTRNNVRDDRTNFDPELLPHVPDVQLLRSALSLALHELEACGRGDSIAAIRAASVLGRS